MATITSNGTGGGLWHSPASWDGGSVPAVDDTVIIDADDIIELDGDCECGDGTYPSDSSPHSPSGNFRLWLKGTIKASRIVDSSLAVKGMIGADVASGWQSTMDFGTETDPIPDGINFNWYLNKSEFNGSGYYFGVGMYARNAVRQAKLLMRSEHHRVRNVYLIGEYAAGDTVVTVNDTTGWVAGDELIFAPKWVTVDVNPHYNHDYSFMTIDSISGNDVTLTAGLTYDHGYVLEEDYKAGSVTNRTSNVKMVGGGDDSIFPSIFITRGTVEIKDVVGVYMNNRYSLNTCCLRLNNLNAYENTEPTIESCVFESDYTGYNDNAEGILYIAGAYDNYGQKCKVEDITIGHRVYPGRKGGAAFRNYYGGRNVELTNCNSYNYTNYSATSFSAYQQPVTYTNCKAYNGARGFELHNNVDIDTNDCWAIGCITGLQTYNGTAIHNDLRMRYIRKIAAFQDGWRGKAIANRLSFRDEHVYYTDPKEYVYIPNGLPDGNQYSFIDIQNNTNNQHWYYSYGQKWWDIVNTRNDPHSISMSSTSDVYVVPHERKFSAVTGDNMAVGVFVKNLSATYIGVLTLKILQGSTEIVSEDFDLTTFTTGVWTGITVSGVATKTMDTTFKLEYKGVDGEIALTDFSQPFTPNEKTQAKAVWAELVTENQASGSFGEIQKKTDGNAELGFLTN